MPFDARQGAPEVAVSRFRVQPRHPTRGSDPRPTFQGSASGGVTLVWYDSAVMGATGAVSPQTEDSPLESLLKEVKALRERQDAHQLALLVLALASGPEVRKRFKSGIGIFIKATPPGTDDDEPSQQKAVFEGLRDALDAIETIEQKTSK